ncbi:MAG: hypothetical protein IT335_13885 [Thermomicrobiales bacterium]|jgi:hypothetical protein|nr:hypothetical protein [Thermomicrobiales bacterium]
MSTTALVVLDNHATPAAVILNEVKNLSIISATTVVSLETAAAQYPSLRSG